MNYIPRIVLLLLAAIAVSFTSCAKKPEAPVSPSIKVDIEKKGDLKIYKAGFTCGLKNENSNIALVDITGIMAIKKGSTTVLEIPFKKDVIIPFEIGLIEAVVELTEEKASPLLELLGISKAELDTVSEQKSRMLDEQNISIKTLNFKSVEITELLRSRSKK